LGHLFFKKGVKGKIEMPSPIAHSIVGLCYASNSFKAVTGVFKNNILNYFLIIFISVVPDLDVIPGFFVGMPSKYHHGFTHSFFVAVVFGFILSSLFYLFKKEYFLSRMVLFSALYSLHIILDLFTIDTGEVNGFGMPIFFPFSFSLFRSSIVLFKVGIMNYGYLSYNIVFNYYNLKPFIIELSLSLLIGILIILMGKLLKNKLYAPKINE